MRSIRAAMEKISTAHRQEIKLHRHHTKVRIAIRTKKRIENTSRRVVRITRAPIETKIRIRKDRIKINPKVPVATTTTMAHPRIKIKKRRSIPAVAVQSTKAETKTEIARKTRHRLEERRRQRTRIRIETSTKLAAVRVQSIKAKTRSVTENVKRTRIKARAHRIKKNHRHRLTTTIIKTPNRRLLSKRNSLKLRKISNHQLGNFQSIVNALTYHKIAHVTTHYRNSKMKNHCPSSLRTK